MQTITLLFLIAILSPICHCFQAGPLMDVCLTELGLDSSVAQELEASQEQNLEPSHNGKCVIRCAAQKAGILKDDQFVMDDLPNDISVNLQQCQTLTGVDECDKAYKILRCVSEKLS